MEIFDSVLDMVGNTPLVNLKQVAAGKPCRVVVKAEMMNPGGSSKDRPAVTMIDHAEREGLLKPGGTIVEPTSGNTGVGLAIVAAQRGLSFCLITADDEVAFDVVGAATRLAQVERQHVRGGRVVAVLGVELGHLLIIDERDVELAGGDVGQPQRLGEAMLKPARGGRVGVVGVEVEGHDGAGGVGG